jgi:hypothetical protein
MARTDARAVVAEIEAGRESAHDDAAAIRSLRESSESTLWVTLSSFPTDPLRLLRARERRPPPNAPSAPSATQCTQSPPSAPPRAPSPSDSELSTLPTTLAALREASKPSSPVASDASIDHDMLSPRDDISPVASGVFWNLLVDFLGTDLRKISIFVKDERGLELKYNESATFPICNPALFLSRGANWNESF